MTAGVRYSTEGEVETILEHAGGAGPAGIHHLEVEAPREHTGSSGQHHRGVVGN